MPRRARGISDARFHNVGVKGNNSQNIFFDDGDRERFLQFARRACNELNLGLAVWTLMDNHVHMILHGDAGNFSSLFKSIGASYVQYLNWKNFRKGKLFDDRYYARGISDAEEYAQVAAYIFNNPVAAEIVENPADYAWSNFNEVSLGYGKDSLKLIKEANDADYIVRLTRKKAGERIKRSDIEKYDVFAKTRIPDSELTAMILKVIDQEKLGNIANLSQEEQFDIIARLFQMGSSVTQISRITGLSRRQVAKYE